MYSSVWRMGALFSAAMVHGMERHVQHWNEHVFRENGINVTVYIAKIGPMSQAKVCVGRKAIIQARSMAVETVSIRSGDRPEGEIVGYSRRIYSIAHGRTAFSREEVVAVPDRLAILGLLDCLQQARGEGLFVSPGYALLKLSSEYERFYHPASEVPSFEGRGCCRRVLAQLWWRMKQRLSGDVIRYEQARRDGSID